jgi:hypothetical protein
VVLQELPWELLDSHYDKGEIMAEGIGLAKTSPLARIGLALEGAAAGSRGQTPLSVRLVQQQKQDRLLKLQEFNAKMDLGSKIAKQASTLRGEDKQRFLDAQIGEFSATDPQFAETIKLLSNRPDKLSVLPDLSKRAPALDQQLKLALQSDPTGQSAIKLFNSDGFQNRLGKATTITFQAEARRKIPNLISWYERNKPDVIKKIQKDGITVPELQRLNDEAPENVRLSDEIFSNVTAFENQEFLTGLNIKTEKSIISERKEFLKQNTGFGKSLVGRSLNILTDIELKKSQGLVLTEQEKLQEKIATANISAPRDVIRADPNTGDLSVVTVTPELPDVFKKSVPEKQKRVVAKPLGEERASKKARLDAEKTVTEFSSGVEELDFTMKFISENPEAVGARGALSRLASKTVGQLGVPTDPKAGQARTKIRLLQSKMRPLVDKGKFSDQDRAILEDLLSGLSALDNPRDVINSFLEIRRFLGKEIGKANEVLGKGKSRVIDFKDLPDGR